METVRSGIRDGKKSDPGSGIRNTAILDGTEQWYLRRISVGSTFFSLTAMTVCSMISLTLSPLPRSTTLRSASSVGVVSSSGRHEAFCFTISLKQKVFMHLFLGKYPLPTTKHTYISSLGRYVFGSEISYNKAPPRLPGLGC